MAVKSKTAKLATPDQRMLKLMDHALQSGKFTTERDFLKAIKFSQTNISNIRRGHQSFNLHHIEAACRETGASADWILGLSSTMKRDSRAAGPIDRLRNLVTELEMELAAKTARK